MFEISIFCVILIAVGYWATLFAMGRRDDVLHGHFVEPEPQAGPAARLPAAPARAVPPMPTVAKPRPPGPVGANAESLQALLAVIKQELKDAPRA